MVLWPRSYLHISRVSSSRKEQCGGGRGSRWNAAQHPTHLALEVVTTGSATELPLAYGRPCHRKPRHPFSSTGPSMKKFSASIGKITRTSRPG